MINYKGLPKRVPRHADQDAAAGGGRHGRAAARDVPGWPRSSEAAVLAWQGADPFYNYVPLQKGAAGLEDDPSKWIAVVKDRTGVDLTTADPATRAPAVGGTYTPADETPTATALSAGTVEQETAPLTAEIDG